MATLYSTLDTLNYSWNNYNVGYSVSSADIAGSYTISIDPGYVSRETKRTPKSFAERLKEKCE